MRKNLILITAVIVALFSCGSKIQVYSKQQDANYFKNSFCPDFKLEHNVSESVGTRSIESVDFLPLIVDVSLYNPDKPENFTSQQAVKNLIEPLVLKSLNENSIKFNRISMDDFKYEALSNYKKKIRSASFSLAHGQYATSKYFPTNIGALGNENHKLGFFLQVLPRKDKSQRIYLHLFLFDLEQKKNTYYEYFIYEECDISNTQTFEKVLNYLLVNFKSRNSAIKKNFE